VLILNLDAASAEFERIQEEVRNLFGEARKRWEKESESS